MARFNRVTPAGRESIELVVTCDICGRESVVENDWGSGAWGIDQIIISRRVGKQYPDGCNVTEYTVDLCPDCFETKLIPWLESHGARVGAKKEIW